MCSSMLKTLYFSNIEKCYFTDFKTHMKNLLILILRNHGKKFLKLCQTSFGGIVHWPNTCSLASITRCDLSPRFFCIDATLLCEFESDKI